MQIRLALFTVHKRFPLRISRGTTDTNANLLVEVEQDGLVGRGEACPFSIGDLTQSSDAIARSLQKVVPLLRFISPLERQRIERTLQDARLPSAARAALDTALHDWLGQLAELPLWQMWGLARDRIPPTSVTVGINTPTGAQQRVRDWLGQGTVADPGRQILALKVKLGSPDGMAADQAMFQAVQTVADGIPQIGVDANGGWDLPTALAMCDWLAAQGVTYVEQPLAKGQEGDLPELYQRSPLPIFADESCFTSYDILPLADRVHGVNIKLMKAGGLTESLRMIHTARSCGLKIMFGCYANTTLGNTAMAHLSPLVDYVDLDSHLNLSDDPFEGAYFQQGRLLPNDRPGLGVTRKAPTNGAH